MRKELAVVFVAIGCQTSISPSKVSPQDQGDAVVSIIGFRRAIRAQAPVDGCSIFKLLGEPSAFPESIPEPERSNVKWDDARACGAQPSPLTAEIAVFKSVTSSAKGLVVSVEVKGPGYARTEDYALEPSKSERSGRRHYVVRSISFRDFVAFD